MIGSDELQTYYCLDVGNVPEGKCKDPESVPLDASCGFWDYLIISAAFINIFLFRENGEPRVIGRLRKAILSKEKPGKV